MAQAIAETLFDLVYLSFALAAGVIMLRRGQSPLVKKAGLMAALLGAGDAFHLLPRCYALWTTGLEAHVAALGVGKFITSITMTGFYLLLYFVWRPGCARCASPCACCRRTGGSQRILR